MGQAPKRKGRAARGSCLGGEDAGWGAPKRGRGPGKGVSLNENEFMAWEVTGTCEKSCSMARERKRTDPYSRFTGGNMLCFCGS